ncbi:MAG: hypothetical protein RLZZ347_520 [Candidatus Parcubacteria bacterium]|jgi:prepilin-type N-terminal cleavage/methylation domain-containing protein
MTHTPSQSGFSLVEIVVGSAIIGVVFVSMIATYATYVKASFQNASTIKATYLAEEGVEAIKSMRDRGWGTAISGLTASTTYYLDFSSGYWKSTTTPEVVDSSYQRSFVLFPVYRDGNSDITSSGGTLDSDTKKAVVTVTVVPPAIGATTTKTLSAYVLNIFKN